MRGPPPLVAEKEEEEVEEEVEEEHLQREKEGGRNESFLLFAASFLKLGKSRDLTSFAISQNPKGKKKRNTLHLSLQAPTHYQPKMDMEKLQRMQNAARIGMFIESPSARRRPGAL